MTRPALAITALLALAGTACQTTEPEPLVATPVAPEVPEAPPTAEELFPDRDIVDYTIKPGDSLWLIAENHKIPVADIRNANAIAEDDNKIIAGKSLRIPLPAGTRTTTPEEAPGAGEPVDLGLPVTPAPLTPAPLPGSIPPPSTSPVTPPNAESGLPAPPAPPQ